MKLLTNKLWWDMFRRGFFRAKELLSEIDCNYSEDVKDSIANLVPSYITFIKQDIKLYIKERIT